MEELTVEASAVDPSTKHPIELTSTVIEINILDNPVNNSCCSIGQLIFELCSPIGYSTSLVYLKLYINEEYDLNLIIAIKIEISMLVLLCCMSLCCSDKSYNDNEINLCQFILLLLYISAIYYLVISIIVDSIQIIY